MDGTTTLGTLGTAYVMLNSGGTGVLLQYNGAVFVAGQFGAWAPIGAIANAGGYEVAWRNGTGSVAQYTAWQTNSSGVYTSGPIGLVSGTDISLEALEPSFQQDLNGDGIIGVPPPRVIQVDGPTTLAQSGTSYLLLNSGGTGPVLQYNGATVVAGQFGAWAPIGAIANAGGYEVAWRNGTGSVAQYTAWQTNSSGVYTSGLIGLVSGTDVSLENLEPGFQQDLNGDGAAGLIFTSGIQVDGTTTLGLVGAEYAMLNGAGPGVALQYNGADVIVGQFGAWAPIGATADAGGYEVAWRNGTGSAAQYTFWQTNSSGTYTSSLTGIVSGQDFALQDLEPSFQQDLNGDGRLSTQLIVTGPTVNLSGQSQATTIHLGTDSASASSSLSAPSLTFIGTPDAITLGTGASTVEHALQASSGIETIANFILGVDMLNIDLLGAANSSLQAYDTTVSGVHAIAFASSGDAAHGVVLLNMTGGQTATNLLASHTIFSGGHALIG